MRRFGARLAYVLIAALLLAQQGFALHGLSHGIESLKIAKQGQSDPRGLPADRACDLCLTYSQVAAGAPATALYFLDVPRLHATPVATAPDATPAPSRAYRSRAPPRFA